MYNILQGDWIEQLKTLESDSVQCCVTSPPFYGLRDYGHEDQLGLERTPEEYVKKIVEGFAEVKRVLKKDGTLWLNLGDSYVGANNTNNGGNANFGSQPGRENIWKTPKADWKGLLPKNLIGIPWRVAFALQADGWYLRSDIIWSKPNPMPESVTDRPTKAHEYIFLLAKSQRYYYDAGAIKEPVKPESLRKAELDLALRNKRNGNLLRKCSSESTDNRNGEGNSLNSGKYLESIIETMKNGKNKRSVWEINTECYSGSHFAVFPPEIPELCIKAGSKKGDTILDPFTGSGTTGEVALRLERDFIGIELNQKYIDELIKPRLENIFPLFS